MEKHRMKVLDLLAKGRITVKDAERLLDRLSGGARKESSSSTHSISNGASSPQPEFGRAKKSLKSLRIMVGCCDGQKVNVRIPISFVCSGARLEALLPENVLNTLCRCGVDLRELQKMGGEGLTRALAEMDLNLRTQDGSVVRVYCE